jgi:molybdopterin-synthase adenylyltransferase
MERSAPNEPATGCFECLYRPDDTVGLINRTALTAPGQEIRQSLAGCAGTFSPFSPLDARRTAVDATELAARVLTRAVTLPALVTWRGMHTPFEAAAYQMSVRARQVPPGSRVEVKGPDLVRQDCPICNLSVHATAQANNCCTEPTS